MHKTSKYRVDVGLLISFLLMVIISLLSLFSSGNILPEYLSDILVKQVLWLIMGAGLVILVMNLGIDYFYRHAKMLYYLGISLLLLVLIFGKDVNGAKAWFDLPLLGSFQPSEFVKISLILYLTTKINDFNESFTNPSIEEEARFIINCLIITAIPAFLTFLEPDTGAVMFYFIILFGMLFISGIRKRWFIVGIGLIGILVAFFISIYFINSNLFVDLFGTDSFYRIDRLLNWTGGDAFQLKNAIAAMGSGGFWGNGLRNIPLYFPEASTDFIFAVWVSTFGTLGGLILIIIILFFDFKVINLATETNKPINLYLISGIIGVIIFSQIINIGMTIGLFPIIGITLPFISYGGSSLLSYMIMLGLIFTISNEKIRYTN